jgi:hypothetical protein
MKTQMRTTTKFIRTNQRLLAASLLMASIVSCKKAVIEPTVETYDESALNAAVSTKATGNLIWSDNIEGTSFFSTGVSRQTSTSYGITAATNPLYQGVKSARFELRDSDPEIHNGTRSEISFPDATNLNRWYSYALYAPSAQFKYDDDDDVITQWHQGGGLTPALCLRVRRDHLYIRVLGAWTDLGVFEKDVWRAYVLHVNHSSGSDGLIEIWRDGSKILNKTGPNAYKIEGDIENPNMKLGVYKSNWNGSGTTSTNIRVLHFDDIKIGNENATYADMVPTPNGTIPTAPTDTTKTTTTTTTTPTTTTTTTGLSVTDFKLVNSETEKDVLSIVNGQTISLSALKLSKVNIRAITSADAGSVKLVLSGKQSKSFTDNSAPFALHGDNGSGNFYYGNWNPPALGIYTLKATPYTKDGAQGTAGTAKTITFTIVK